VWAMRPGLDGARAGGMPAARDLLRRESEGENEPADHEEQLNPDRAFGEHRPEEIGVGCRVVVAGGSATVQPLMW